MFESIFSIIAIAIVIALNNLTVSLSLGAMGQRSYQTRILLVFGVFEFMLPLIGVWLGQQISSRLVSYTDWLGPLLLAILGAVTVFSAV